MEAHAGGVWIQKTFVVTRIDDTKQDGGQSNGSAFLITLLRN